MWMDTKHSIKIYFLLLDCYYLDDDGVGWWLSDSSVKEKGQSKYRHWEKQ